MVKRIIVFFLMINTIHYLSDVWQTVDSKVVLPLAFRACSAPSRTLFLLTYLLLATKLAFQSRHIFSLVIFRVNLCLVCMFLGDVHIEASWC